MIDTRPMTSSVRRLTGSRKRTFWLSFSPDDTSHSTASYWDSGSRDKYSVINMRTGRIRYPSTGRFPIFKADTVLEPGEILVGTGVSQGKPSTSHLHVRESDKDLFDKWNV